MSICTPMSCRDRRLHAAGQGAGPDRGGPIVAWDGPPRREARAPAARPGAGPGERPSPEPNPRPRNGPPLGALLHLVPPDSPSMLTECGGQLWAKGLHPVQHRTCGDINIPLG